MLPILSGDLIWGFLRGVLADGRRREHVISPFLLDPALLKRGSNLYTAGGLHCAVGRSTVIPSTIFRLISTDATVWRSRS